MNSMLYTSGIATFHSKAGGATITTMAIDTRHLTGIVRNPHYFEAEKLVILLFQKIK